MVEAKKKVLTVLGEIQKSLVEIAENAITFLISLSDGFANRYNIQNRVFVVLRDRKVVSKHRILETIWDKIEVIEHKFL